MPEDYQVCNKCGGAEGTQQYILGAFPTSLCIRCRGDLELYIRSIPKYEDFFYYSSVLGKLDPSKKEYDMCLKNYYALQTELLPFIVKWLKEHKKGNLVSLKK